MMMYNIRVHAIYDAKPFRNSFYNFRSSSSESYQSASCASTEESKITESIIMTFSVERKWKARIMKSRKQIRADIKTEESN